MNYYDLFRVTLPETALEVAALLVLIVDLAFLRKAALKVRLAASVALGVAGCGAALWALHAMYPFTADLVPLGLGVQLNMFTVVPQAGILVLTACTLLLFIGSEFTRHVGEFVAVVLMAAAGGLLIASAHDLLVIFIGLELLSLGLYILTAFAKSSERSAESAIKYYLFGGMSAAFLLFGFSYFYGLSGSTNLYEIQRSIAITGPTPLLFVGWILVVAGLGFKVAAVPFHFWAPDTYEGAPASAVAFIASVSKVASFALLVTIADAWFLPNWLPDSDGNAIGNFLHSFQQTWPPLAATMLLIAAASMVVGNLAALAQVSVRRLLAYSAIAHAGYILLGVSVLPSLSGMEMQSISFHGLWKIAFRSSAAIQYYVLTYGLTTIGAFGVVGVVERATGSDRMDSFLGLHKRNPVLAGVLLILFLSLAGIPPLVGFWAKFNLFAAVLGVSAGPIPFALVCLAVALSAVSLYYYIQVLKRAYVMPGVDETPIKAHPVTMAVLVLIAAAVVVLGCFPSLLQNWIASFYPTL